MAENKKREVLKALWLWDFPYLNIDTTDTDLYLLCYNGFQRV